MRSRITWIPIKKNLLYDGSQLSSRWIDRWSTAGNVIISFSGPCDVSERHMMDLEDLKNHCAISSDRMLHYIIRHNKILLPDIVVVQRFFISIIREALERGWNKKAERSGDDLFVSGKKLSISIATEDESRTSGLIHAALNITRKGTPPDVKAISLDDFHISPQKLNTRIILSYLAEWESIIHASKKVRFP
jgi:uncharacterized protein